MALTLGGKGIISGADVRSDLEFNGLADPNSQESKSSAANELEEVMISRRFKSFTANVASVDQCRRQELEMYLRRVSEAGGNLAEAARQLKIKRTTLHMRIKKLHKMTD